MQAVEDSSGSWRTGLILVTLGLAILASILPAPPGIPADAYRVGIVVLLMAVWWMTETVPLAVTALVPIVAFPLIGAGSLEVTARSYAHPLIFLFLGGFMLAAAMQRWGLHRRVAISVLSLAGSDPRTQILAIMSATAFLSMWISNTATAMVMAPIGLSLVSAARISEGKSGLDEEPPAFGAALMLGIAFAATIGGMGSLIGTPPNALLSGYVEQTYGRTIGFAEWMLLGVPVVLILLPVTWLILVRGFFKLPARLDHAVPAPSDLTPLSREQRLVAAILVLTGLAWVLRPLVTGVLHIPGLTDTGIAMTAAFLLFLVPDRSGGTTSLLRWEDVKGIRWDVLILFGGGLALADAIGRSGLASWISSAATVLHGQPTILLVLVMMVLIVYLGELASNTAMAAIFLPIAGAAALGLGAEPLALLVPVALAASLGFMLPVATPPNAIVYGTGAVSARQMLRVGAVLNVVSIAIVFIAAQTLGVMVF
jgi:solute carrier family 13 (sodium-dependent dicarboxylate transporter), member 2/3/5